MLYLWIKYIFKEKIQPFLKKETRKSVLTLSHRQQEKKIVVYRAGQILSDSERDSDLKLEDNLSILTGVLFLKKSLSVSVGWSLMQGSVRALEEKTTCFFAAVSEKWVEE